ncbi:MAG: hypothetical protein FJ186_02260 [Gammaproteobacteria bacterium]|nr:hypothetical protein [Gammaproteobacteria bacterium]
MNCFAKCLLILLLPSTLWGHVLSHTLDQHQGFTTINIESSVPTHLNPEGITLNDQPLISDSNEPLPISTTFKTPPHESTLRVYACLDNGQCLMPYTAQIFPSQPSLIQIIITSSILALSTVFNPCLAPLWLIVSSQFRARLLSNSFLMSAVLLLHQSLLQVFGTQIISMASTFGLTHAANLFLLICIAFILFENKFTPPPLIKNHTKLPSFLAIILSSSCLLPLQIGTISSNHQFSIPYLIIGAVNFFAISSIGFWWIAKVSQQAYQKALSFTPKALRFLAFFAAIYMMTQQSTSAITNFTFMILSAYLALKRPRQTIDLILLSLLLGTGLYQPQIKPTVSSSLHDIELAKLSDNNKLFVTADWCPNCQKLKLKLEPSKTTILWLDITHLENWKEQWLNHHRVIALPSCFISKDHQWQPCPNGQSPGYN